MKRCSLLFGALLMAACGGTASAPSDEALPHPIANEDSSATTAFETLTRDTNADWHVAKHTLFATTSHLEGRAPGVLNRSSDGFGATLSFLEKYKDLFSMRAPADELVLTRERVDSRGMRHVRMQQVVRGLRVVSAEMLAHFDKSGALVTIDARYVPDLDALDLSPNLDKTASLSIALADARQGHDGAKTTPTEPELVVFANGKSAPALAYYVRVRVDAERPYIFVYEIDATDGRILNKYDDVNSMDATGVGVKGDTKRIQVSGQGSTYTLVDTTRTANNITTYTATQTEVTPGDLVSSDSLTSWDTGVYAAGAAVDAHFNAGVTYDYYKKVHARAGIDGQDAPIVSTVHFSKDYDNAFWDGQQMLYGDGDGTTYFGFAAGLDVVGHELTHGVTQSESKLDYQDQSGALNESISDIMGCFVEHAALPNPTNNWLLGENIGASPTRSMIHPAIYGQPAHMSDFIETTSDYGGVHVNSGIPNNADYLMTMGGTNDKSKIEVSYGIGWQRSQTLWYLVNTEYLASGSDFAAGALATLSAAKALGFSDNEQNIVECAWIAVGVLPGTCKTLSAPPADDEDDSPLGVSSTASSGGGGSAGPSSGELAHENAGGCATSSRAPDTGALLVIGLAIAVTSRRRKRDAR